ncbi:MAG TPA: DUF4349 domain-containing protein [Methylomirabilota bacterium]|nr:DUF4349 domain-containing protein [Methylomirabilota bacterium]
MTRTSGSRLVPSLLPRLRIRWRSLRSPGRRAGWLALAAAILVSLLWLGHRPPTTSIPGAVPRGSGDVGGLRGHLAPEEPVPLAVRRAGSPETAPTGAWGRQIIRQATLAVELGDVEQAIARLTELVEAAGGYVADTQTHADTAGVTRATVTVYVPPAAFGRTLRDLEPLGRVTSRRISGQDVSEEFVDLEARVRNLERHEAQLVAFMGKAQKVADLVSLEGEVARVRGEIERLTGRLRFLRARTEMAAIQVGLVRVGATAPPEGLLARAWERVRREFVAGWRTAFDVAVGIAALAAQLSPLGIPAGLAWALYRRVRRQPATPPPTVAA